MADAPSLMIVVFSGLAGGLAGSVTTFLNEAVKRHKAAQGVAILLAAEIDAHAVIGEGLKKYYSNKLAKLTAGEETTITDPLVSEERDDPAYRSLIGEMGGIDLQTVKDTALYYFLITSVRFNCRYLGKSTSLSLAKKKDIVTQILRQWDDARNQGYKAKKNLQYFSNKRFFESRSSTFNWFLNDYIIGKSADVK